MAAYAYEAITVADTAIGITEALIAKASSMYGRDPVRAIVTVETAQIRFRDDGGTPQSTVGHLLNIGDSITINGPDLRNFRAIRTGSDSASIKVTLEV